MRFPCPCGLSVLASRDDPEGTFGTRSSRTGISGRDSVLAIIQPFTDLALRRWNGGTSVIPPGVWVSLDTHEPPSPFDGSTGPLPPLWRRKNGTQPFILIGRAPRGFSLRSGCRPGARGKSCSYFCALCRSTKTALAVSNFCPPLHP